MFETDVDCAHHEWHFIQATRGYMDEEAVIQYTCRICGQHREDHEDRQGRRVVRAPHATAHTADRPRPVDHHAPPVHIPGLMNLTTETLWVMATDAFGQAWHRQDQYGPLPEGARRLAGLKAALPYMAEIGRRT